MDPCGATEIVHCCERLHHERDYKVGSSLGEEVGGLMEEFLCQESDLSVNQQNKIRLVYIHLNLGW